MRNSKQERNNQDNLTLTPDSNNYWPTHRKITNLFKKAGWQVKARPRKAIDTVINPQGTNFNIWYPIIQTPAEANHNHKDWSNIVTSDGLIIQRLVDNKPSSKHYPSGQNPNKQLTIVFGKYLNSKFQKMYNFKSPAGYKYLGVFQAEYTSNNTTIYYPVKEESIIDLLTNTLSLDLGKPIAQLVQEDAFSGYFILDSKVGDKGQLHYYEDKDYVKYSYDPRVNKLLKRNAVFLYRRPQSITDDHKFRIDGGGVIKLISKPGQNGHVHASIIHGFKLIKPLKQGDPKLENINWTSKNKREGTWEHFWNQYGINKISQQEFFTLINHEKLVSANNSKLLDSTSNTPMINHSSEFTVTIIKDNGHMKKHHRQRREKVGHLVNYDKQHEHNMSIGDLGEEIVLNLLTAQAKKDQLPLPERVSQTRGDGLGYDILAWDAQGNEQHIEVKTTNSNYKDGFLITQNEVDQAKHDKDKYFIYRVFALNKEKMSAKIYIINDDIISSKQYNLEPTKYKFYINKD